MRAFFWDTVPNRLMIICEWTRGKSISNSAYSSMLNPIITSFPCVPRSDDTEDTGDTTGDTGDA